MSRPSASHRSATDEPVAHLDESARRELERALGAWQRRRVILYFAIAAALLALSTALGTFTWPSPDPARPDDPVWRIDSPAVGDFVDTVADATLTLILLVGLLTSLPRRRTHREVVATLQLILVAMTAVIVAAAPFAAAPELASDGAPVEAVASTVTFAAAAGIFLLHFGASALVALSPREALRPLIPMALLFGLTVLFVAPVPWPQRIGLATLGAVAGVPGLLWSVARYRRFQERFVARFLRRRVDELDRDLDHARRLHESLLPTPLDDGPLRVSYRYEPMQAIGGDFLTLRRTDDGDLVVVVADVTGHGIAAALAVNRLHGEIDRLLVAEPNAEPRTILAALNRYTGAALASQGIYATAFCVRIDPHSGRGRWANAGHPPAVLLRADGQTDALGAGACMLGVLESDLYRVDQGDCTLRRGDRLVVYTDGASEAFDRHGTMFGIERIVGAGWLRSADDDAAHTLADAVARFRAGPPRDDLLAVAITYVG